MTRRVAWIYRAYDERGELLYVGKTVNLVQRERAHRRSSSPWWPEAVRFRLVGPMTVGRALPLEDEAIWSEGPIYNRPHSADFPAFGLPTYSQAYFRRLRAAA